jgi:hypothetical protein
MPHRQAAMCRELQSVAARAYVIGTPRGYGFSISDGLISQIQNVNGLLEYQLSCPISPGNSGSPVLNKESRINNFHRDCVVASSFLLKSEHRPLSLSSLFLR